MAETQLSAGSDSLEGGHDKILTPLKLVDTNIVMNKNRHNNEDVPGLHIFELTVRLLVPI